MRFVRSPPAPCHPTHVPCTTATACVSYLRPAPSTAHSVTYGLGIGFGMHAAPAYIAETAPPSVRGLLISLKEAAIGGCQHVGLRVPVCRRLPARVGSRIPRPQGGRHRRSRACGVVWFLFVRRCVAAESPAP